MPHKRAKRSIREQQRNLKGEDLAPSKQSLSNEAIPKSLARVLNAANVREQFKKRKIASGEPEEKTEAKRRKLNGKVSGILPGESLQHYNKRVEDDMRPLVKSAVQSSNAVVRHARHQESSGKPAQKSSHKTKSTDDTPSLVEPLSLKHSGRPMEFQSLSSSAPRRLNDIAQAPPELMRLPRGVSAQKTSSSTVAKRDGVLSLAQKAMMAQERENAITRYRQLKASRRKDNNEDEEIGA
ncbi:hypothetical protein BDP27DRAFT_1335317 [Rhodocollybia butyracea]|uniref:Uncharacterized protein n=1 Tax=Rhodocollybia butyracea TaxID=206335 RepID=A0A9P5U2A3_9AGAR|nr:hypothetical protein BDP27DRAFT_1335317 [Rhodocollybia butyracea]